MTVEEKAKKYALKMYPILDERYDKHLPQSDFRSSNEEAYIEGYNEAKRWRDVKNELPKDNTLVLTKMGDDINLVDICRYMGGRFTLYYKNQYSDYASKPMFREDLTDSITHWRPIETHINK